MDRSAEYLADNRLSPTDYAIVTCDRQEKIISWDKRAELTFGWSAREALGQQFFYLLLPPGPESLPELTLDDIVSTGSADQSGQFSLNRLAQHKDGTVFKAHFLIFEVKEAPFLIALIRNLGKQQHLLDKINTAYEHQTILDDILQIAAQPFSLSRQLEKTLDRLFAVDSLNLLPRGAVFLSEARSDTFTLKARRGFDDLQSLPCSTHPQGVCEYGQAARYEPVKIRSCMSAEQLANCCFAKAHGHYCSPIRRGKSVVGILCLYCRRGHPPDGSAEQLIHSVCAIIAGMVENREMELQLISLTNDLQLSVKEVKEQKKFAESIIQGMTTGLIVTDLDGNVHGCNELAESIMRPFAVALKESNLVDVLGDDAAARLLDLNHGASRHIEQELAIRSPGGEEKIIGYSAVAREDGRGREVGRIISLSDITELKFVRKEMEKMNRLATVAEIASAVAHEVRNPLAGIKIMAQSIQGQSVSPEEQSECLTRIIRQVDRLNSLLTEFFSYARPAEPQICKTSLLDIIAETRHLIANKMIKNHITFKEECQPGLPAIVADPNQVQQVLLNLLLNAMDAIGKGGLITLTAAHLRGPELARRRRRHPGLLPESSYVAVAIADNGIGMEPEIAEKVFEPFFTTKSTGTGLGLSIVYRTLRENNAAITVQSKPNGGTTFTLYFTAEA